MKVIEKLGLVMMFAAIMLAVFFIEEQVGDKRTVIEVRETNYYNVIIDIDKYVTNQVYQTNAIEIHNIHEVTNYTTITNTVNDWQSIIMTNGGIK